MAKITHYIPHALLALLMAGQSICAQYLSALDWQGLVFLDCTASLALVLMLPARWLRVLSVLQAVACVLIVSYVMTMAMQPTLAAVVQGLPLLQGMAAHSLGSYVDMQALGLFSAWAVGQWLLCGKLPALGRARLWALVPLLLWGTSLAVSFQNQPLREFLDRDGLDNQPRRSLKYRGYVATFTLEAVMGNAFSPGHVKPLPCRGYVPESVPVPLPSPHVSFVQVESLDFELLDMEVDGEPVMPFMRSLLPHAVLLRLDGVKKLASANSDFEIFNALEARPDVVHYEYELSYPTSLLPPLKKQGRTLMVFHGLPASYMNLQAAYAGQDVDVYYDLEAMKKAGVQPLKCWWAGVVSDKDLFAYAAAKLPSRPYVQFLITMTMHLPEYLDLVVHEKRFTSSSKAAFLTLAHDTDAALRAYVQALPPDALLVLWGDHRSYGGNNSGTIPFLVYGKDQHVHYDGSTLPPLPRCAMHGYLRRLFRLPALADGAAAHCARPQ